MTSAATGRRPAAGRCYDVTAAIVRPALQVLTKREWTGAEHVPREGGVIIAANHLSYFDPFALAHFVHDQGRAVRFLAKSGLFDAPLVGPLLRATKQIPVHRETRAAGNALTAAEEAVRRGECVIIYPEGTITRDPDLWPMVGKTGVARVALATRCSIVPVAQWGAHEVLAPYARTPRILPRKTMRVAAGAPIDLADYHGQAVTSSLLKAVTGSVMKAVTELLAQLRGVAAPAELVDPRSQELPSLGNFRRRKRRGRDRTG